MNTVITQNFNITLRHWQDSDIEGYATLGTDPGAMKYISNGQIRNRSQIEKEVSDFRHLQQASGFSRWAATLGTQDVFLGYAGFEKKDLGINFGMRFLRRWWGTPWPFITGHLALCHAFDTLEFSSVYTLTNILHSKAIRMNMKYLNIETLDNDVHTTLFGPHQRIIYTRKSFEAARQKNELRIARFLNHRLCRGSTI